MYTCNASVFGALLLRVACLPHKQICQIAKEVVAQSTQEVTSRTSMQKWRIVAAMPC